MTKVTVELEWEQIDAIVVTQLKVARDEMQRCLDANIAGEEYFRVYFNGQDDPDGSKDRLAMKGMVASFNDVLGYWGKK